MKQHQNNQNKSQLHQGNCLSCGTKLQHTFVDLGMSPPCESYRKPEQKNQKEEFSIDIGAAVKYILSNAKVATEKKRKF